MHQITIHGPISSLIKLETLPLNKQITISLQQKSFASSMFIDYFWWHCKLELEKIREQTCTEPLSFW